MDQTPFFDSFVVSLEQVESLFDDLTGVFHIAHPAPLNLDPYGGAIRDLIILGCTEVESQWKRVLKANNVAANDDRYTTNRWCGTVLTTRSNTTARRITPTLRHAISAIAAHVELLAVQFGEKALRNFRFKNQFQFTGIPLCEPKDWCAPLARHGLATN